MTTKRYMSNKKTSQQTISISPSLRDWIRRYVSVMHKKNPEDENYKSISAFYCSVMENVLKIFEKGKTIEDFDKVVDRETIDIFDKITYKAVMPLHDIVFKTNRYNIIDLNSMLGIFITLRKMYLSGNDILDIEDLKKIFERMRVYLSFNKLLKDTKLDYVFRKNKQYPIIIFEFSAIYKNLHYENCKFDAILIGMLGGKIINLIYSPKDCYTRFEIELTELAFRKHLTLNERKKLIDQNLKYFTNYWRILDDKDYYLWMKLTNDKDTIINFNKDDARRKWIEVIEADLRKFGTKEEFLLKILNYFDRLHWIKIENNEKPAFKLNLSKEKNEQDIQFLFEYLSKYANISEKNDIYYLEILI